MRVIILGSGGREHALAHRLSNEAVVEWVYVIPGNPGMDKTQKVSSHMIELDFFNISKFYDEFHVDFIIAGSEAFIFSGLVDKLRQADIKVVGPTQAAGKLESSKIFGKKFMERKRIPTAEYFIVDNFANALKELEARKLWPGFVLKSSGPALGKGVFVTSTIEEAKKILDELLKKPISGMEDGLLIEKKKSGRECSLFYACLNESYHFLGGACDYKRFGDGDVGPNTGGMGAYSPVTWLSEKIKKRIELEVLRPTLKEMKEERTPFQGILFLGLMIEENANESNGAENITLLEYNVRLGDPEAQVILSLLKGKVAELFCAMANFDEETFTKLTLEQFPYHAVHVVKVAKGYPGIFGETVENNQIIIDGISAEEKKRDDIFCFFSGVREVLGDGLEKNVLVTNGGRVLGLTALGPNRTLARNQVYEKLPQIHFAGEYYRSDIALDLNS